MLVGPNVGQLYVSVTIKVLGQVDKCKYQLLVDGGDQLVDRSVKTSVVSWQWQWRVVRVPQPCSAGLFISKLFK